VDAMTYPVIKAIVLNELQMVEEDMTVEQRIALAIEITIRLLDLPLTLQP
jgi:hypothetical protein